MRTLVLLGFLLSTSALAHDQWADGEPVPAWVKNGCCGPNDVHKLRLDQVRIEADGFHVDGLSVIVPFKEALPSPDPQFYWGFWSSSAVNPTVHCFFAPVGGT